MSFSFSLPSGESLPLIKGCPRRYNGQPMQGACTSYVQAAFGYITVQQVQLPNFQLIKIHIQWDEPAQLICDYDFEPVLFTRVMNYGRLYSCLKGAGDWRIEEGQFASVTGSQWRELFEALAPGEYEFVNTIWPYGFVQQQLQHDPAFIKILPCRYRGIPNRMAGPPHAVTTGMREVLTGMMQFFHGGTNPDYMTIQMKRYFDLVIRESVHYDWTKTDIKETDWQKVHNAMDLISDHEHKDLTIPQISVQVALSESKLKQYFPRVTGYTVDEYRKKQLCISCIGKIQAWVPLKLVAAHGGYSSFSAFVAGFRKHLGCTPGEIAKQKWKIDRLIQQA